MTPEKRRELDKHIEEIANILYEEADPTKIENLAGIESTIREQTLEYITPKIGFFWLKKETKTSPQKAEND